jgi:hypothetical protein
MTKESNAILLISLKSAYKILDNAETIFIANYVDEYGEEINWNEEIEEEFNNLHTPICEIKGGIAIYIDELGKIGCENNG